MKKKQNRADKQAGQGNRREFLGLTAAAVSGLALSRLAPVAWAKGCVATTKQTLQPIGEIVSADKILRGVVDLTVEERAVSYYTASKPVVAGNGAFSCDTHFLRAYQGYRGLSVAPANAVFKPGQMQVEGPGPTLRLGVGETMEVLFMNRIDPALAAKTSLTSIKQTLGACDTSYSSTGSVIYPTPDEAKRFPNCFHASNTTNLHWHGTHTSPNAFADNVLLGIVPDVKLNVQEAILLAKKAFQAWNDGKDPTQDLIKAASFKLNAMYQAAKLAKNEDLAVQLKAAIDGNEADMHPKPPVHPEFPQFWPGWFPYRLQLPRWSGDLQKYPRMGQSPGTHWYHCHQHGSTTLQILNGMAGALIITDNSPGDGTPTNPAGYDYVLKRLGYQEQVLVMQLFSEQPNQLNGSPSAAQVAVNGQIIPNIVMKQGEVQWWRVIDACMKAHGIESFVMLDQDTFQSYVKNSTKLDGNAVPKVPAGTAPSLSQCAQDGVQLNWTNFNNMKGASTFLSAPGNRADFLVQAPNKATTSYLVFWPAPGRTATDIVANTVLQVTVSNERSPMSLPDENSYPKQPLFLADITDAEVHGRHKQVDFAMQGGPPPASPTPPVFTIDGRQFEEHHVDQSMLKDTAEEWLLTNTSLGFISHPFHIHINPFQVTEVYDPATMTPKGKTPDPVRDSLKLKAPYIWWDVISIPAGVASDASNKYAVKDPNGAYVVAGFIRMRSRFDDFAGKFVLHCHILGHEDRGMMQLVEVTDSFTQVGHGGLHPPHTHPQ